MARTSKKLTLIKTSDFFKGVVAMFVVNEATVTNADVFAQKASHVNPNPRESPIAKNT
jgi:hypothetical protein